MKEFQKIIKYLAIAFGLYLAITIIGFIISVGLAICTGICGVQMISEQTDIERIDITKNFEEFSKLKVEIASANLTIKSEGEEFKIETYQIPEATKIQNSDGTLVIKDTKKFVYNNESNIIIYIPVNTKLEEMKLELGAGTVNIEKINSDKIEFSFGAGSVNVKELISEDAKIECGAGQVIIEDTNLYNAKIDSGVGKLVYSGEMTGNSKVNCGIGEVILNLQGGTEKYSVKTEKGLGDIKVNGTSVANESTIGNGANEISVEGGIGNIEINM